MLVALGLRHDGKKEVIDYRLARGESAAEWERFLADLYKRGLTGEGLDMICVDGGSGLLAALPMVYDKIPSRRCWAHKIRNVLNKVKKADEISVKADLHAVMNADTAMKARSAARRFAERWGQAYPACAGEPMKAASDTANRIPAVLPQSAPESFVGSLTRRECAVASGEVHGENLTAEQQRDFVARKRLLAFGLRIEPEVRPSRQQFK